MKKKIIKGFVYFEGVKTGFNQEAIKRMTFEEFKTQFEGRIQYKFQAKDLQPELKTIYAELAGKKKPVRRKAAPKKGK